jgi:hypothetical protein
MNRAAGCARCGLESGFIHHNGAVLDNRDGFFNHFPDPLRQYDSRTHVAISRARLEELLRIELETKARAA